jgi:type II secretory pathway component PulM
MKGYWNNLRPFEKRVLVGVASLFFVVLNFLLVIPHFSDWGMVRTRKSDAEHKISVFQAEIDQMSSYERRVKELENEGLAVPPEEQDFQFANAVNSQASRSGVRIIQNGTIKNSTNQFFVEKSQSISVQAGEAQLVDFLYNLGASNSLIRVRDLGLRPEQAHHDLVASIQLVASYLRKAPAHPAASPRTPGSPIKSGPSTTQPQTPATKTSPSNTKKP